MSKKTFASLSAKCKVYKLCFAGGQYLEHLLLLFEAAFVHKLGLLDVTRQVT